MVPADPLSPEMMTFNVKTSEIRSLSDAVFIVGSSLARKEDVI
jgi:hypothetical protein